MKSNYKLGEDQSWIMKSILHPYDLRTTNDQVHYLVVVGLLHLLINACMRGLFGIPLELPWLALFWVLLAFLDQPFWLLQLSISNVPRITSLPSTTLGLPTHRRQAPTLGRSDLSSRTILDTHLKWICWLTQVMDLIWWVTLIPSLSHFLSTCLSPFLSPFLSIKWFSIATRT